MSNSKLNLSYSAKRCNIKTANWDFERRKMPNGLFYLLGDKCLVQTERTWRHKKTENLENLLKLER